MDTLLGIAMLYVWIHSTIIIFKKLGETTSYENVVLIAGLVAVILFVIGTIS